MVLPCSLGSVSFFPLSFFPFTFAPSSSFSFVFLFSLLLLFLFFIFFCPWSLALYLYAPPFGHSWFLNSQVLTVMVFWQYEPTQ